MFKRNIFESISARITIPFIVLILAAMFGLQWYLSNFIRQTYISDLKSHMISQANLISDVIRTDLVSPTVLSEKLDANAQRWSEILNVRVTLIANDGTVIGESDEDRTGMENHADRPEVIQASNEGTGISIRTSATLHEELMYTAVRVIDNGKGLGYVRVAVPTKRIESAISHFNLAIFGTTLILAIVASVLASTIARTTTRPLRVLTQAANQLASGESWKKIETTTHDEVGELTHAFNQMVRILQEQVKAVRQESHKLTTILQEMTDGVMIIDQTGSLLLMNPAAEKLFSVTSDKSIGKSIAEVVRQHQLVEIWQQCKDKQENQVATIDLPSKKITLQAIATSMGSTMPEHILLVFQDITQLRQLETVRRDFISNISHELRTPLASLKALAETLQTSALNDPPAARRFLQQIETEVDSLSLMVSELLELSRIESGKVPLQLSRVAPEELMKRPVERLHLQAENANLTISVHFDPDLPPVLADTSRIEQVVVNLLHNAIKFTPPGGSVELNAHLDSSGRHVLFSVKDTGTGIADEDQPRIFERFYKADRARSGSGTGLGLAISRHLVDVHGGSIWVESKIGQGSTFYFKLPVV